MRKVTLLLTALLLCLSGCGKSAQGTGEFLVYYAATEDSEVRSAVVGEARSLPEELDPVSGAMSLLNSQPTTPGLVSPYPSGTQVSSWRLEDGILYVDFNERYSRLTGVQLTLADYCTVLTLTQLDGVEQVSITAAGEQSPERARQLLRAEDVLLQDSNQSPAVLHMHLWFPTESGNLGAEDREILVPEDSGRAMAVLRVLCAGPETDGYQTFLPEHTDGVTGWMENSTCYLNLPASWVEFLEREDAVVPRDTAFQAIAGAMVELDGITTVRFLQEGEPLSVWNVTES